MPDNLKTVFDKMLLNVQLNFTIGTYNFYLSHIKHFLKWCNNNDIILVSELDDNNLIKYISDLKLTCNNATINKRIGIIKRSFKNSNIDFTFLYEIPKLKETIKTFKMIPHKQLRKIIKYMETFNSKNKLVYQALILLLIDTGARINEIINIKRKNVNLEANEILLTTTKTATDRTVYFLNDTKEILNELIKKNLDLKYLLFNKNKNRKIKYDDVRYLFRKIKADLNIDVLHSHMFRHTFATILIENDADLISVMTLLGHKNIKTTERYLHLSNKHIKRTYQNKYKRKT